MDNIEQVIKKLEDMIESAKFKRFSSGEVILNRDELMEIVEEIKAKLPEEMNVYKKNIARQNEMLKEAKEQADQILSAAQIKAEQLVNNSDLVRRAQATAQATLDNSRKEAQEILDRATTDGNNYREAIVEYSDDVLGKIQKILEKSIEATKTYNESLIKDFSTELNAVKSNRAAVQASESKKLEVYDPEAEKKSKAEQIVDDIVSSKLDKLELDENVEFKTSEEADLDSTALNIDGQALSNDHAKTDNTKIGKNNSRLLVDIPDVKR